MPEETHRELIDKIIHDRRLYTWRKTGSSTTLVPIPNLDDELAAEVIEGCNVDMVKGHA